jgi:hypothetical protein
MFTRESISNVLKEIQASVPKMLKDATIREVPKTPTMEFVFQKAMEDPNITLEKKEQIRKLLASGMFSKKTLIENPKVAKMRDEYITRQIKKAVKEGRLPNKKQLKELGLDKLDEK